MTYVLALKEILSSLNNDRVVEDLKSGTSGAPKLSEDQLAQLQQFGELVNPLRELREKGSFEKQVNTFQDCIIELQQQEHSGQMSTSR